MEGERRTDALCPTGLVSAQLAHACVFGSVHLLFELAVNLVAQGIAEPSLSLFVVAAAQHDTIGVHSGEAHDSAPDLAR
jgi:hypothetical protein